MAPAYRVGCSGWSYEDWKGGFYPAGCDASEYLGRYARVFDTAEIDSTFYRSPRAAMAERWRRATPDGFRFCPKLPRRITHDGTLAELPGAVREFLEGIEPLRRGDRLGPVLAQFPATFRHPSGADRLRLLLEELPGELQLAVELRHASWWKEAALAPIEGRGAALVWSVRPGARAPERRTGAFLYLRFVGDRALTRFDRIQRDGRPEMEAIRDRIARTAEDALTVYALVNNHYMGFGPGSVQILREVLGLPPLDLSAAAREVGQMSLAGFGGAEDRG